MPENNESNLCPYCKVRPLKKLISRRKAKTCGDPQCQHDHHNARSKQYMLRAIKEGKCYNCGKILLGSEKDNKRCNSCIERNKKKCLEYQGNKYIKKNRPIRTAVSTRLEIEMIKILDEYAAETGKRRSEIIEDAIKEYFEKHGPSREKGERK